MDKHSPLLGLGLTCLGQHIDFAPRFPFMEFDDPMDDGDVPAFYVEHHNLACSEGCTASVQKKNVSPVERWLHASGKHDNYLHKASCISAGQQKSQASRQFVTIGI